MDDPLRVPRRMFFVPRDLQILRSSLIITGLFEDAARFRCARASSRFSFLIDRAAMVHEKELHGKAF
jgi:hypothetical protein